MTDFELIKFAIGAGGVRCDYRLTKEIDGVPYEMAYSVNDTRQVHPDLLTALKDFDTFLGDYFGADSTFVELKYSGKGERRAVIVKAAMNTALGVARVKLPKVRFETDDRESAVDLAVCCSLLEAEVRAFLLEDKVGELTPITEI